ncbi:MAG: molybdopterin-dependent oxidoreductase [Elusimicrobia bacterium]|nr:molybdopterin-dependent oxidoreductase [Elusimicrobiota bacterium]
MSERGEMEPEVSRRNLLKWGGFAAAAAALPQAVKAKVLAPRHKPLPLLQSEELKPAVCKLCPSFCMLQVRVVNGKAVGVSGLPGHPMSQGAHCPKGGAILQDLYHPDRVRTPLVRRGPRGAGGWEKASWDEALALVRSRLEPLLGSRPEALAMVAAPIRDIRHEIQRQFARVCRTPNFWEWSWPLGEAPLDAFELMHGSGEGLFYDLQNASLIVSFGWDWLQSFPSPIEAQRALSELRRARPERRVRVIQVEPRLSTTAAKADDWIAARPGSEGLVALSVAHVLLEEGLYDKGFVSRWTSGFDEFKRVVLSIYGPRQTAEATGVEPARVAELAREMASIKPALAITYRGTLFAQVAAHSLNALLGSIGVRRGVLATEAERYQLRLPAAPAPAPASPPLAPSLVELPGRILAAAKTPVEALWLERVNPVFLAPAGTRWAQAIERVPFVVSFSQYLDETSSLADLVLPPHHSLEAWQYGFSRTLLGQGVISFAPPVVRPLYDTGDHGDFLLRLARALGGPLAKAFPWETFVDSLRASGARAETRAPLQEGGWRVYEAAKADAASTLKSESRRLKLPAELFGSRDIQEADPQFPLRLHVHTPLAFSFGEGGHLPFLHSLAGAHLGEQWETWVELHPATAARLGVRDRQWVWVESKEGRIKARARHYIGVREDTAGVPLGLGHTAMGRFAEGIGSNPMNLLPGALDPSGRPRWQQCQVKVYGA